MPPDRNHERARAFATALDREDYPAARALMSDECAYRIRGEEISGADNIIASYLSHGEEARQRFDQVAYESKVEMTGDHSASLHYTDLVTHGGDTLVHRCRQHVEFDADGLITSIVHEDLEGEAERLAEFKARHPE